MNRLAMFVRRIIGFMRALVGRRKARRRLKELRRVDISAYVNRIISDAVLLNEIPSPTDNENLRMDFVMKRLSDFGISNVVLDDAGNVAALFPAFGTRRDFLLMIAEVGDAGYSPLENSVHLASGRAVGQGLGEMSLGAAALIVLAEFAQTTGFHLDKNLLLLFTKSSSIDENSEGFGRFLDAWAPQISCGIIVRGNGLGVVESRQVGMYRLSVEVRTAERELLSAGSAASAAHILGAIAFQIGGIAWDPKIPTVVNIARIECGIGYGHWPAEGTMDVEILSEQETVLETTKNVVISMINKVSAGFEAAKVNVGILSHHSVGDSRKNQQIIDALRTSLSRLHVKPSPGIISEKVALLNDHGVPGVCLGVTTGKKTYEEDYVDLQPIVTGFRQILLVTEMCASMFEARSVATP